MGDARNRSNRNIHKLYGNGAPPQPPVAIPDFVCEGRISTSIRPKQGVIILSRDVYTEQDGKRFIGAPGGEMAELPADARIVFIGDKVDESLMDLVVTVEGLYAEPSVFMPNGQTKAVVLALGELARVDFLEFKKRGKAALKGLPGVPNFIDHEEPWTEPTPPPEPLSQS